MGTMLPPSSTQSGTPAALANAPQAAMSSTPETAIIVPVCGFACDYYFRTHPCFDACERSSISRENPKICA
jgi:hypothetical protein